MKFLIMFVPKFLLLALKNTYKLKCRLTKKQIKSFS